MLEHSDTLNWLQAWYRAQCDGEWEHGHGIHIATLDNPGWSVAIDLRDTALDGSTMKPVEIERSETDWVFCSIKDRKFAGYGGAGNLLELLEYFRVFEASTAYVAR